MTAASHTVLATDLPGDAGAAAQTFYADVLPQIRARADGAEGIVVLFARTEKPGQDWRLAAMQDLARALAPVRVNGLAVDPGSLTQADQVLAFLDKAPGVTGQLLAVDGNSGENH